MQILATIGKNAALAVLARIMAGRTSLTTGAPSVVSGRYFFPQFGQLSNAISNMPKAEVVRLLTLVGELILKYVPYLSKATLDGAPRPSALPTYLADGVHFMELSSLVKGASPYAGQVSKALEAPIWQSNPYTGAIASIFNIGAKALAGTSTPTKGKTTSEAPRSTPSRSLFSFDGIHYSRKKEIARLLGIEQNLGQQLTALKQKRRREKMQQQHEAELAKERERSEMLQNQQYEQQMQMQQAMEENRRQVELAASQSSQQLGTLQEALALAQLQGQSAQGIDPVLLELGLSSETSEEEGSYDSSYRNPNLVLANTAPGGRSRSIYIYDYDVDFDSEIFEYQFNAEPNGWPSPYDVLADLILNTAAADELQYDRESDACCASCAEGRACESTQPDCVGCSSGSKLDAAFTVNGRLPRGPFFSSSWVDAHLTDLPNGVYGMINTNSRPFRVSINRNVALPRAQVSYAHEMMHALDDLLKLNLSHDQVHSAATMLVGEVLPGLNALTEAAA